MTSIITEQRASDIFDDRDVGNKDWNKIQDNIYLDETVTIPLDLGSLAFSELRAIKIYMQRINRIMELDAKYNPDYEPKAWSAWVNEASKLSARELLISNRVGRSSLTAFLEKVVDRNVKIDKAIREKDGSILPNILVSHSAVALFSEGIRYYRTLTESGKSAAFCVSPYGHDLISLGTHGFDETCYRPNGEFKMAPIALSYMEDTVFCCLRDVSGEVIARCWGVLTDKVFVTYNRYYARQEYASAFKQGVQAFAKQLGFEYEYHSMYCTNYDEQELYINSSYSSTRGEYHSGMWYVKPGECVSEIHLPSYDLYDDKPCECCGDHYNEDDLTYTGCGAYCPCCLDDNFTYSEWHGEYIDNDDLVEIHDSDGYQFDVVDSYAAERYFHRSDHTDMYYTPEAAPWRDDADDHLTDDDYSDWLDEFRPWRDDAQEHMSDEAYDEWREENAVEEVV